MIGHFVRRDLRDFLPWWVGLAAVTLVATALAASSLGYLAIPLLWWAYYMFAFVAGPQVLGSVWRTQHQWSRHYLLALPISHRRLFAIQNVRIAMFWLPLVVVSAVAPAVRDLSWGHLGAVDLALYYFGLPVSVGLLIEMQIWMTLDMERIAAYLPKNQRVWAWLRSMGLTYAVMVVLSVAWFDLLSPIAGARSEYLGPFGLVRFVSWSGASFVIFPVAFVLAVLWARHNARRWCVTL